MVQVRELLQQPELWWAAVAGVAVSLVLGRLRAPDLAVAFCLAVAVVRAGLGFPPLVLPLLLVALWLPVEPPTGLRSPLAASATAVLAAYACAPDTERALVVLGALGGVGAVSALTRRPWGRTAACTTAALVWVAVADGRGRASAVVGVLGVAVIHGMVQQALARSWPRWSRAAVVGVAVVASGVSARVAGLGPGVARPLLVAAVTVAVTLCALAALGVLTARAER